MNCDRCGNDNLTDLPVCPSCAREVVFTHPRQTEESECDSKSNTCN